MALINKDGNVNGKALSNSIQTQKKVFSQVDAVMAILEKLPMLSESVYGILNANTFNFSASPLGFLFNLLKTLGVSEATIREWIVEILVYTLPTVEVGLKGLLLSNLKSLISCNSDVRIPFYLRKSIKGGIFDSVFNIETDNADRGLIIPISAIDPEGLLDLSPFTTPGNLKYFGCMTDQQFDSAVEEVMKKHGYDTNYDFSNISSSSRIAKLTRADDFNAFLWYVIHKGQSQNPIPIKITGNKFEFDKVEYEISNKTNIRGVTEIICNGESSLKDGATLYESGSTLSYPGMSIVIDTVKDEKENKTHHILVEVSSDWYSCNWYVDKSNYYSTNMGFKLKTKKSYEKEVPICNLKYLKQSMLPFSKRGRGGKDNLLFTILPKPSLVLPYVRIDGNEDDAKKTIQPRVIRLLFDEKGKPDSKGRFSPDSEEQHDYAKVNGNEDVISIGGIDVKINASTGEYSLVDPDRDASKLVECYKGLTVYEFNYDYVMGMKLFDPKVVCQKIIESTLNPKYDVNFSITLNKQKNKAESDSKNSPYFDIRQRVTEVIWEVLNEDEDEINDCFFKFSNDQYSEMMQASDEIRAHKSSYTEGYGGKIDLSGVNDILGEYSSDATLEEQKDVISRALVAASAAIEGGYVDVDFSSSSSNNGSMGVSSSSSGGDFMTQLLQQLILAIIDSLLSPKVLMLLMVNNELMRNDDGKAKISTEDLMKMMKDVIKSLIKEVRDMIMKKILDYIIKTLTPLMLQIQAAIASEQLQAYLAVIRMLLGWLNKGIATAAGLAAITNSILKTFSGKNGLNGMMNSAWSDIELPTVLDNIGYADIYPQDAPEASPIIEKC